MSVLFGCCQIDERLVFSTRYPSRWRNGLARNVTRNSFKRAFLFSHWFSISFFFPEQFSVLIRSEIVSCLTIFTRTGFLHYNKNRATRLAPSSAARAILPRTTRSLRRVEWRDSPSLSIPSIFRRSSVGGSEESKTAHSLLECVLREQRKREQDERGRTFILRWLSGTLRTTPSHFGEKNQDLLYIIIIFFFLPYCIHASKWNAWFCRQHYWGWEDEVKHHLSFVFLFIFYIKICDRRRQCLPCRAGSLGWYSVSSVSRTMTVPAQPLAAPLGGIRRIPTSIHIASRWRSNHLACTPELDRGRPMLVDGQGRSRRNSSLQNWTQICIGLQIMSRKCKNLPTSYSFSGRDLLISLFPSIACRFTSKCDQIHSASLLINGDWTVFSSFPKPVQCLPGLPVCRFLFGAVWSA